MSVTDAASVDAIGIERATGRVVLTISDHLDWENTTFHLQSLQAKINTYLRFVESGEILESYPQAVGRNVDLEIVAQYDMPSVGIQFLDQARTIINEIGIQLRWRKFVPS